MIFFLFQHRKIIIFFLLCFLSLFIIGQSAKFQPTFFNFVFFPLSFVYRIIDISTQSIGNRWNEFFKYEKIRQENELLQRRIIELKKELKRLKEIEDEKIKSQNFFSFQQTSLYTLIYSHILVKDPSNWFSIFIIDKGEKDKLKTNMIVISYEGLVGRIIAVNSTTAKIQTLLSKDCKIGVKIQNTGECGILEGLFTSSLCQLKYLPWETITKKGDIVLTSGFGELFPKGLIIGEVVEIKKQNNELYPLVKVKPYVNFSRLEEVMIIMNKNQN